jgi:hypothetical protein
MRTGSRVPFNFFGCFNFRMSSLLSLLAAYNLHYCRQKSSGASDSTAIQAECAVHKPRLVMIGYSLLPSEKRRAWAAVKEYCEVPVLELHREGGPELMSPAFSHESLAARTSNPAFSSVLLRTSARRGSCDTTRILSFAVTHNGMPLPMSLFHLETYLGEKLANKFFIFMSLFICASAGAHRTSGP